jgi:hypothetical protein
VDKQDNKRFFPKAGAELEPSLTVQLLMDFKSTGGTVAPKIQVCKAICHSSLHLHNVMHS